MALNRLILIFLLSLVTASAQANLEFDQSSPEQSPSITSHSVQSLFYLEADVEVEIEEDPELSPTVTQNNNSKVETQDQSLLSADQVFLKLLFHSKNQSPRGPPRLS